MTNARSDDGFTLIELIVAMGLMLLVLGAVLTAFGGFSRTAKTAQLRTEAQDRARVAVGQLARDLRNQVPAGSALASLERSEPYDLVLLAPDPAAPGSNTRGLRRVRYCLDATDPTSSKLLRQTQTWTTAATPAMPTATACPGSGWTTTTVFAEGLSNRRAGNDRPLWRYGTTVDAGVTTLTGIDVTLWMIVDRSAPTELSLNTGVALRNANRPPIAEFTVSPLNGAVILNAAPSQDPEGAPMRYAWFVGGTQIGASERIEYPLPTGSATVTLRVTDNGDVASQITKTVSGA